MTSIIKPKIALIAGGYSGEAQVSVRSAAVISEKIDKDKFEVYVVSITRESWHYEFEGKKFEIDKNDFSLIIENHKIKFDAAFIMIHGTPGEDGKLQSYFEMLEIPYTTSNSVVSALTFNKYYCNRFMQTIGAKVAKSLRLIKNEKYDIQQIANEIGFPCFVKPNSGGSSIGASKVLAFENLENAICTAFNEDNEVLVEQFISGSEITCGLIKSKNKIIAFPLTEVVSKKEFFDFEAKYDPSLADEITPARISADLTERIQKMSIDFYQKLNCEVVVRFDYIVDNEEIWFLEVNTIPGMSAESIVPQQATAYGLTYTELTTLIIEEALSKRK